MARPSEGVVGRMGAMIRPVFETALISAAAYVCAYAGWALVAPGDARATNARNTADNADTEAKALLAATPIRSPFDPMSEGAGQTSGAGAAFAAAIQLQAVRVSTDPATSSAFLILSDGAQKAFLRGAELGEGVVLSDIGADFVVLRHPNGERRISLEGPSVSYALAMLGKAPTPSESTR